MLTEKEATIQFSICVPSKYFKIHRQCRGRAIFVKKLKRLFAEWDNRNTPKGGIIDYILEPTELLLNMGWKIGSVGVEIKSSYMIEKYPGRAIVQILDYQACKYSLPDCETELSMIFLYPYRKAMSFLGSIMQQEGLGFVRYEPAYDWPFQLLQANSNEPVFSHRFDDQVEIRIPRYGKKFGHR